MKRGKETVLFSKAFYDVFKGLKKTTDCLDDWSYECDSTGDVKFIIFKMSNMDEATGKTYRWETRVGVYGDSVTAAIYDAVRGWHEL